MNREIVFKDSRLLEALEYIDRDLIAGAMEDLRIDEGQQPSRKNRAKAFLAFAACLLFLVISFPMANYITGLISSFRAGAGSGTTEESAQITIPENTEFPYDTEYYDGDYLKPIKGLEPLPVGLFDNLKKHNPSTSSLSGIQYINASCWQSDRYLGCFNGYYIFLDTAAGGGYSFASACLYNIDGYTFFDGNSFGLYAYKNTKLEPLGEVYTSGMISEEQLKTIYLRNNEYTRYFEPEIKIPDIFPITEDDFIKLNEAWADQVGHGEKLAESMEDMRIENAPGGVDCFGKIDSCIFFATKSDAWYSSIRIKVAGYEFGCSFNDELWIMHNEKIYTLQEAYEFGVISADTVGELAYCFETRCAGISNY